jgi:hypothetical protein
MVRIRLWPSETRNQSPDSVEYGCEREYPQRPTPDTAATARLKRALRVRFPPGRHHVHRSTPPLSGLPCLEHRHRRGGQFYNQPSR